MPVVGLTVRRAEPARRASLAGSPTGMAGIAVLLGAALVVVAVLAGIADLAPATSAATGPADRPPETTARPWSPDAYRGLGAWVDVFDFAPTYRDPGQPPTVTPAQVPAMAAQGATTLYLQAARADAARPDGLVAPDLVGAFLVAAHRAGLRVVAWYAPAFADVDADLRRLQALAGFRHEGHRFDGLAVDIEFTGAVADHEARTGALVQLSRRLRAHVGDQTLGAVVLPPVLLEDVNPDLWPGYPWDTLADVYDVWLPMSYWTFREAPWDEPGAYTQRNVERLRERVGPDALVHVLGGVGDVSTVPEVRRFAAAVADSETMGASVYNYGTLDPRAWSALREQLPPEVWTLRGLRD